MSDIPRASVRFVSAAPAYRFPDRRAGLGRVALVSGFVISLCSLGLAGCSTNTSEAPHTAEQAEGQAGGSATSTGTGDAAPGSGATETGGAVELGGTYNARQTGGLVTADGQVVKVGVLIRSGDLASLNDEACQVLEDLGVQTVIDLRASAAAGTAPDALCVVEGTAYYQADIHKILPPTADNYLATLDALEDKLSEVFERLSADGALPAIVHCVIGRDRASLMTALVLMALGVSTDVVLDDFEQNQDASVGTDRAWMQGVVARIEAAGGIEKYLRGHGVTSTMLEDLRAGMLD